MAMCRAGRACVAQGDSPRTCGERAMLAWAQGVLGKVKIWVSITAIVGTVVGVPVAMCSTATFQDMLTEYGWNDGVKFPGAVVGQFYAISNDGSTREPLCSMSDHDLAPNRTTEHVRVVNKLGKSLPFLPNFAMYLGIKDESGDYELKNIEDDSVSVGSLLSLQERVFEIHDIKNLPSSEQQDALRFQNCTDAIKSSVRDDNCVTEVFDVITDRQSGDVIALDVQPRCIVLEGQDKKMVPEVDPPSIWTKTKKRLGLVASEPILVSNP